MGRGRALPRGHLRGPRARLRPRRARIRRALRSPPAGARDRAPRDSLGRGLARGRDGHRPHRSGCRHRGLRALEGARPTGARPGRRERTLPARVRVAPRHLDRRGRRPDPRRSARARPARARRDLRAPLSALLALRDAAHLSRRRRLVHRRRGAPPEAPRRERERGVDARVLREAHGRLVAKPWRLEHFAQALLRPAVADLPVRLRARERDRLEGRVGGARDIGPRPARGAAPPLGRQRADPLRGVRRGGSTHTRGR